MGTKRKHDFEPHGKMRKIGPAQSDSCPRMIRKLGAIPRTLLATCSAMQICPTRALGASLAIPTPALTNCISPFRLLRKHQFPDLVRSPEDLGNDYGACFIAIRRYAPMSTNFVRGLAIIDRAPEIMDKAVES